jgi:tRNA-dihydrouridine synthase C
LWRIVSAVRQAVPAHQMVSAKMRLGFLDDSRAVECAQALQEGGAGEIVVHARTRADAYRPPAYWSRIADIRAAIHTPLVANGEIWNTEDASRARRESGCMDVMLGRGIVTDPGLGRSLRALDAGEAGAATGWDDLQPHLHYFWAVVRARLERRQQAGRLKQWLNFLRRKHPQAELAFNALRTVQDPQVVEQWFASHPVRPATPARNEEIPCQRPVPLPA